MRGRGRALVGSAVVAIGTALGGGACGGEDRADALEVYAAASLREAMVEVVAAWEAQGGRPVALNFGPSGGLARQIVAARQADVFVSAGEKEMDAVEEAGLVVGGTRRVLLENRLVVIEPAERESLFGAGFEPGMLVTRGLEHLSIGNPEYVPAGRYAKEWLEREGLWDELEGRVAPAVDVRAALAAVEAGVARAGVVYATDARVTERVRVVYEVPVGRGPVVVYPVACVGVGGAQAGAREFVEWLTGQVSVGVFEGSGFVVVGAEAEAR